MVMRIFGNGLVTGFILQLAIGPVFFFLFNLTLQAGLANGLAGVVAVTLGDYLYITLAILGVGKLLEVQRVKKFFGIVSSVILAVFGLLIIKGITGDVSPTTAMASATLFSSFVSVFLLTISSPLTIVFVTSLFTAKSLEYGYKKNELLIFGLGTGFATFLFMGTSVVIFSLIEGTIPISLIQILNVLVGCLLIGYGGIRMIKSSRL
jgi:threonine/homoserine/homoserine lactone efflux protein